MNTLDILKPLFAVIAVIAVISCLFSHFSKKQAEHDQANIERILSDMPIVTNEQGEQLQAHIKVSHVGTYWLTYTLDGEKSNVKKTNYSESTLNNAITHYNEIVEIFLN